MAVEWLNRTLVYAPLCYSLCLSVADFRRELKRLGVDGYQTVEFTPEGCDGAVHHYGKTEVKDNSIVNTICIVCFDDSKLTLSQAIECLVHESVHVWQAARKNLGEKKPSTEFEAYSIENISSELIDCYLESEQGKKKLLEAAAKVKLKPRKPKRKSRKREGK